MDASSLYLRQDNTPETFYTGAVEHQWNEVSDDPLPDSILIDDEAGTVEYTYNDFEKVIRTIEGLKTEYTQEDRKAIAPQFRFELSEDLFGGDAGFHPDVVRDYVLKGPSFLPYTGPFLRRDGSHEYYARDNSIHNFMSYAPREAANDIFGDTIDHADEYQRLAREHKNPEASFSYLSRLAAAASYWIFVGAGESRYYEESVAIATELLTNPDILPNDRWEMFCPFTYFFDVDSSFVNKYNLSEKSVPYQACESGRDEPDLQAAFAKLAEEIYEDDPARSRTFKSSDYHFRGIDGATKDYYQFGRDHLIEDIVQYTRLSQDPELIELNWQVVEDWIKNGDGNDLAQALSFIAYLDDATEYQVQLDQILERALAESHLEALERVYKHADVFEDPDTVRTTIKNHLIQSAASIDNSDRAYQAAISLMRIGLQTDGERALRVQASFRSFPNESSFEATCYLWNNHNHPRYNRWLPRAEPHAPATDADRKLLLANLYHATAYLNDKFGWDRHTADSYGSKPLTFFTREDSNAAQEFVTWLTGALSPEKKATFLTQLEGHLTPFGLSVSED